MQAFFFRALCLAVVSLVVSQQALAQPSTKKIRSRDLLVLERQRAQQAAAAHQLALGEMQARLAIAEKQVAPGAPTPADVERLKEELKTTQRALEELKGDPKEIKKRWFWAIRTGDVGTAKTLLDGFKVNIGDVSDDDESNCKGFDGLLCAIEFKQAEVIALLVKRGANVNVRMSTGTSEIIGRPAIVHAANNCDKRVVEILVKAGANVNDKQECKNCNTNGSTPLMVAVSGRVARLDLINFLLEKGADIQAAQHDAKNNAANNDGRTVLMHAAIYGNPEIVGRLVEAGADWTARSEGNFKRAIDATVLTNRPDNFKMLLRNGVSLPEEADLRAKAITFAQASGDAELIELVTAAQFPGAIKTRLLREDLNVVREINDKLGEDPNFPEAVAFLIAQASLDHRQPAFENVRDLRVLNSWMKVEESLLGAPRAKKAPEP